MFAMRREGLLAVVCLLVTLASVRAAPADVAGFALPPETEAKCLQTLRAALRSDEFWPAMHAAEALTLAGRGEEVIGELGPRIDDEADDQRVCGLARELVRAGDLRHAERMLEILAGDNPHGHLHAAESLYKVAEIGDGSVLRATFAKAPDSKLRLMTAGALARCGSPAAMKYLRRMLASDQADHARIAAWLLARIGDRRDIPQLRTNVKSAADELTKAYFEHALAALGDAEGLAALAENLRSEDPAVRTYAAVFAGDAGATALAGQLTKLLDDRHLDVRVRAAQSLLVFSRPEKALPEDLSLLVYQADQQHPRYTEGSVVRLNDGSLLYAVTEFSGSGSDFARARIVARRSDDGGLTWGPPRVLQRQTGKMNVMSVTLRRLAPPRSGRLAMFYLEKNGYDNLQVHVRFSDDEGQTFGEPVRVTTEDGYHVLNNDRVTQLSGGRLLVPVATTPDVRKVNRFVSLCWISDDGGKTWRRGKGSVSLPKRGAMEPEVVELLDGRVLMIMRTQLGSIAASFSADRGDTWSATKPLPLKAPEAPATLRRIPATGDLLLIWNNHFQPGAGHGGRRTPLTAAISDDEGKTWRVAGNLESDPQRTYSYPSLIFVADRAIMTYWERGMPRNRLSNRFRSLPLSWFYRRREESP